MSPVGVLNLCKEAGPTSHDLVAAVRKLLPPRTKVGHAGTLDPMATGVLPICIGAATKLFPYLLECRKTYHAVLLFGRVTDTQDVTGKILAETEPEELPLETARALLDGFRGKIEQIPPMHSALRVGGARLHELARAGVEVERERRGVEIFDIHVVGVEGRRLTFDVTCSRGTYIRTLCHDLGERRGTGGCLEHLTRTALGPFLLGEAVGFEEAKACAEEGRLSEILVSLADALTHLPMLSVRPEAESRLRNGAPLGPGDLLFRGTAPVEGRVRLLSTQGELLAVGRMRNTGRMTGKRGIVAPERIFSR